MKKKINFCLNKSEAIKVSQEIDKFGLQIQLVCRSTYSYNDLQTILNKLRNDGIEVYVDFPEEKKKSVKKDYEKCGKCKFYTTNYGCINDISKVRNKQTKTKNSKGCYWGEWI